MSAGGDGAAGVGDSALVDDDGYPTECGIAAVRGFHGSPAALVDLLEQMWWTPTLMTVDEWLDGQLRTVVRVSLVTGGWSGNEQLIDSLDGSMFHLRFWESSHRGGLHVYEISKRDWDVVGPLGAIRGRGGPRVDQRCGRRFGAGHTNARTTTSPGTWVGWWCLLRCNETGFACGRGLVGGWR